MAVTEPCYVTREAVKKALDVKATARSDDDIDRSIQAASRTAEGLLHRVFYPRDMTRYFDWPSYQYAYPWRVWLDAWELAANATSVTTGGESIPLENLFFEPVNSGPPFTYFEINRATNSAFGVGPTPQRDIAVTGTYGYDLRTASAGALAAAVDDTAGESVTVTNSAGGGVGDVIVIDSERMLLADKVLTTTGQSQQGAITNSTAAQALTVQSGAGFFVGETVTLDQESMLVTAVTGDVLAVKRGWDGTTPAAHTDAIIYAPRLWTVTRGGFGTSAATHLDGAAIARYTPPSLVTQLALADAENDLLQAVSGYARTVGAADNARPVSGQSLADIRAMAYALYGRKVRRRTI